MRYSFFVVSGLHGCESDVWVVHTMYLATFGHGLVCMQSRNSYTALSIRARLLLLTVYAEAVDTILCGWRAFAPGPVLPKNGPGEVGNLVLE